MKTETDKGKDVEKLRSELDDCRSKLAEKRCGENFLEEMQTTVEELQVLKSLSQRKRARPTRHQLFRRPTVIFFAHS